MAGTTKKSLLFLAGGVAAAAIVAYAAGAFDPWFKRAEQTIAAQPEAQAPETAGQMPEPVAQAPAEPDALPDAGNGTVADGTSAATDEDTAASGQLVAPSFDLLRVEGDGSIVIAGKAAKGAAVDLLVGSKVIGSGTAGAEGDFAVVFDEPLKPGDYQIVLRSTAPDNVVAMSIETAVVSVPSQPDGQVLALVEEPGRPSQMITVPAPQQPATVVSPPEEEAPQEQMQAAEAPQVQDADGEAMAGDARNEQAKAPAVQAPKPEAAQPPGSTVRVEAVEIDGRKVFVAGAAEAGRTVRGYANEILLGDAKASPDGHFLIETERDLPVGDYIVRVDVLGDDGVKVAARAAVPFEREPGETIAAVAPPPQQVALAEEPQNSPEPVDAPQSAVVQPEDVEATPAQTAKGQSESEQQAGTGAAGEGMAEAPVAGETQEMPVTAGEQVPTAPDVAEASSSSEPEPAVTQKPASPKEADLPESRPSAESGDQQTAMEEPSASQTAGEQPAEAPTPDEPDAVSAAGLAQAPDAGQTEAAPAAQPEQAASAQSPDGNGEVETVLAPKLEAVGSAVIIRRGDTLWQISRRVYGRGVRYSTIYLANQNQIEDPNRIWPGQVFNVPGKSIDGKADADYQQLGDRLTESPAEGEPQSQSQEQE